MTYSKNHLPRSPSVNPTPQRINFLSIFVFFGTCLFLDVCASALAQERLSPNAIEDLLTEGVHPKRVVGLIKQLGVNFELTDELRNRFKKAGAGTEVMQALELAVIRYRLAQGGEKAPNDERTREQPKPPAPQLPPTKTDSPTDKDAPKTTGQAKDLDPKRRASSASEERSNIAGNQEIVGQKPLVLPSQLQEKADHVLKVENVSVKDGDVSGELVNISQQGVFAIQFQVLYSWRWNNDFKPGGQDPGRAEYFTIDREIRPGQRVPFNHKPSPPLPARNDGSFDISVKVIGFSKIFR